MARAFCAGARSGAERVLLSADSPLRRAGRRRMAHEEIFGPVAPISRFERKSEAIARANDTEYGLAAYIYTRDLARGMRVAAKIEAV